MSRFAPIGIRRNLLRPSESSRSDRVTFVELFFDLIFVFALTQSIYESFGDRAMVFAVAYVVLQLGRTLFIVLATVRHDSRTALTFTRILRHGRHSGGSTSTTAKLARTAYTYVHAVIISGIVLISVADRELLSRPEEHPDPAVTIIMSGGPVLYLLGSVLFRFVLTHAVMGSHLVGIAALLVLGFAAGVHFRRDRMREHGHPARRRRVGDRESRARGKGRAEASST